MCTRTTVPSGEERICTRSPRWLTSHRPRPPCCSSGGARRPASGSLMCPWSRTSLASASGAHADLPRLAGDQSDGRQQPLCSPPPPSPRLASGTPAPPLDGPARTLLQTLLQLVFRGARSGQRDDWSCPPSGGGRYPRWPPPIFSPNTGPSGFSRGPYRARTAVCPRAHPSRRPRRRDRRTGVLSADRSGAARASPWSRRWRRGGRR